MRIFLISAFGEGAGKTTLAQTLVGASNVASLAGAVRSELASIYPMYNWYNKTQAYKEATVIVAAPGSPTMRGLLIRHAEAACEKDPYVWARKLAKHIKALDGLAGTSAVAVDDLRKPEELEYLRACFPNATHFHITNYNTPDSQLEFSADYLVERND